MTTRYTRCQAATKKGRGPQCSNGCFRMNPDIPNLMDRCATHQVAFVPYEGVDIICEINETPYNGPGGQATPNASGSGRAARPVQDAPIYMHNYGPGQQPPIMQDARMRPRRRSVHFPVEEPIWDDEDSEYDDDDHVAPIPEVGGRRREPSPTPRRHAADSRASPAPQSPGATPRFSRPEISVTPRPNAPPGCDPSVSEFEYLLRQGNWRNLALVVGTDMAQSLRQLLKQIERPKQQIHFMKDHPEEGVRPNSRDQVLNKVLAIMLERQSTTEGMIMTLCDVLAGVFKKVAELSEDYRARSQSRSRSRSVASRGGRRSASVSQPPSRARSPSTGYYASVEEEDVPIVAGSSGAGIDAFLDQFADRR